MDHGKPFRFLLIFGEDPAFGRGTGGLGERSRMSPEAGQSMISMPTASASCPAALMTSGHGIRTPRS